LWSGQFSTCKSKPDIPPAISKWSSSPEKPEDGSTVKFFPAGWFCWFFA
jgi:hypothetical protein